MMKKWSLIVLSLLVVIALSACSGNGGNTAQSSSNSGGNSGTPKGKITFAYWGAQSEADAIKQAIDNFKKTYPDIQVESQWIQKDYLTKLQTMIAGGLHRM